jgi:hypothetical protein
MAEFKLKTPVISFDKSNIQRQLSDKSKVYGNQQLSQIFQSSDEDETITLVETNENAVIIGSLALFFYITAFIYIFVTSFWRKYFHTLSFKSKEPEWGFWGYTVSEAMIKKNSPTSWGFTLSDALAHGEKIGATILMVISISLIIGLQIEQGFLVQNDNVAYSGMRYSLIIFSFVLLASFLLLFWIPPSRNFFKMSVHGGIALLILIYVLYASYVIVISYDDFLKDEELVDNIEHIGYTMVIIILLIMCGLAGSLYLKQFYTGISIFIGVVEVLYIILFAVVLGIFMNFPSFDFLNYKKICASVI